MKCLGCNNTARHGETHCTPCAEAYAKDEKRLDAIRTVEWIELADNDVPEAVKSLAAIVNQMLRGEI